MEEYYYEEDPDATDGPLNFVIYKRGKEFEDHIMMAWCYEEDFAKLMVDSLNKINNGIRF
jgi:hypothetical protein